MKHPRLAVSRLTSLAAFVAALLAFGPARATVMRYLSLDEHIALSDLVVRGRIGASHTFVGERNLPFTDTTVEVLEVLHGSAPKGELRIRQMRGEIDGVYTAVPGDAVLTPGEEVILFVGLDQEEGVAYLTALGQSKYRVAVPPVAPGPGGGDDPTPVVLRDLSDATFYVPGPDPSMTHGIEEAPIPLDLFRSTVRDVAKAQQ